MCRRVTSLMTPLITPLMTPLMTPPSNGALRGHHLQQHDQRLPRWACLRLRLQPAARHAACQGRQDRLLLLSRALQPVWPKSIGLRPPKIGPNLHFFGNVLHHLCLRIFKIGNSICGGATLFEPMGQQLRFEMNILTRVSNFSRAKLLSKRYAHFCGGGGAAFCVRVNCSLGPTVSVQVVPHA